MRRRPAQSPRRGGPAPGRRGRVTAIVGSSERGHGAPRREVAVPARHCLRFLVNRGLTEGYTEGMGTADREPPSGAPAAAVGYTDAQGHPTDDPAAAVRGEITEYDDHGRTRRRTRFFLADEALPWLPVSEAGVPALGARRPHRGLARRRPHPRPRLDLSCWSGPGRPAQPRCPEPHAQERRVDEPERHPELDHQAAVAKRLADLAVAPSYGVLEAVAERRARPLKPRRPLPMGAPAPPLTAPCGGDSAAAGAAEPEPGSAEMSGARWCCTLSRIRHGRRRTLVNMRRPSPEQRSRSRPLWPRPEGEAVAASTYGSVAVAAIVSRTVGSDAAAVEAAPAPPGGATNGGAANDASPNGRLASGPSETPGPG